MYNYIGGNNGDPNLFLTDIFKNDPIKKLNSVNIEEISSVLSEQLNDYLSHPEEERDEKALNFIKQSIGTLATLNPDNVPTGKMNDLLQSIASKAKGGNDDEVKEILSSLSLNAGVETFKTATTQTGQELTSHFGEFTYTDNGKTTTFSDNITDPGFSSFVTDIGKLMQGTHPTLAEYKDDPNVKGVVASQAANMVFSLSDSQQQAVIEKLSKSPDFKADDLLHLMKLSGDNTSNLAVIINKINVNQHIDDMKNTGKLGVDGKANIFAEIIEGFTDPNNIGEMQALVDMIVKGKTTGKNTDFLGIKTEDDFLAFKAGLSQALIDAQIADPQPIIDNLTKSLGLKGIKFGEYYADTLNEDGEYYNEKIDAGFKTPEDADKFLDSLTDAQKADPALFTAMMAEKEFNTEEEYENFMQSMNCIMESLSDKTQLDFNVVKTNFMDALLANKPNFNYDDAPTLSDPGSATGNSFLAYLTSNFKDTDDAQVFLNILTDTQKADPKIFTEIVANKEFKDDSEYDDFMDSIQCLIDALSDTPEGDAETAKTSLTTALLTNRPQFDYASDNENTKGASYLAFLSKDATDADSILSGLDVTTLANDENYATYLGSNDDASSKMFEAAVKEKLINSNEQEDQDALKTFTNNIEAAKKDDTTSSATTLEQAVENYKTTFALYNSTYRDSSTTSGFRPELLKEAIAMLALDEGSVSKLKEVLGPACTDDRNSEQAKLFRLAILEYAANDTSPDGKLQALVAEAAEPLQSDITKIHDFVTDIGSDIMRYNYSEFNQDSLKDDITKNKKYGPDATGKNESADDKRKQLANSFSIGVNSNPEKVEVWQKASGSSDINSETTKKADVTANVETTPAPAASSNEGTSGASSGSL
jgi:hypothetical protein